MKKMPTWHQSKYTKQNKKKISYLILYQKKHRSCTFIKYVLFIFYRIPSGVSPDLRDLLLCLLRRNAKDRISFESFFSHRFLQGKSPIFGTPSKLYTYIQLLYILNLFVIV